MNSSPLISIITPCYNHGIYIDDAIQSIKAINTTYSFEHIIVNDGSTDEFTINKLKNLEAEGHNVICQINMGLSAARNTAIAAAKGKYIIPLDSDNKLHSNYLTKAIDALEKEPGVDIIYGDAIFFGKENGLVKSRTFDLGRMSQVNYIDACAVIRKDVFDRVGGYDTCMKLGNEDWEFWIHAYLKGANFSYLNDVGFYYRVTETSMRLGITTDNNAVNHAYILNKHGKNIIMLLNEGFLKWEYIKKNKLKAAFQLLAGRL